MAKVYILTVALLLTLPGCCGRKKDNSLKSTKNSTSNVKKYMDMDGDVKEEDAIMMLDEDMEEGMMANEDMEEDEEDEMDDVQVKELESFFKDEEDADEFSWVDAQVDDEFKTVHFEFNNYGIKADQKKLVQHDIDQVKQLLAQVDTQENPVVVIEGHACQEGTPAYNLSLSEKRAKNVADLFVAAGIDKNVIKVVGRGQEIPVVANAQSREDRAPNRRVEVRVIYT